MSLPPGAWPDEDPTHTQSKPQSQDTLTTNSCTGIFLSLFNQVVTPVQRIAQDWWTRTTTHTLDEATKESTSSRRNLQENVSPTTRLAYRELHPPKRRRSSFYDWDGKAHTHTPGKDTQDLQKESVKKDSIVREVPFEERYYNYHHHMNARPPVKNNRLISKTPTIDDLLASDLEELQISQVGKERYAERARLKAEALRLAQEAEEERIRIEEAEKLKKAGGRRSLNAPFILDRTTYQQVTHALHGKQANETITTAPNGTELTTKDCITLWGQKNWLNDEIVNTQLSWICLEANKRIPSNDGVPAVAALPSFFYTTLVSKGYSGVARWAKRQKIGGSSLLKAHTILIPVNSNMHWTLLVISPQQRRIEYLDSFGGQATRFFTQARAWLAGELAKAYVAEEWREETPNLVRQTNGYDCGVFLLTNAELCSFGVCPQAYEEGDMPSQRMRIACILLDRGFGKHAAYLGV